MSAWPSPFIPRGGEILQVDGRPRPGDGEIGYPAGINLLALAGNRPLGEVGVTVISQSAPLGGEPRSQLGA